MTIASEISRLQTDKEAMRQAIIDKWVDVASNVSLDDYAACISSIQSWPTEKTVDIFLVWGWWGAGNSNSACWGWPWGWWWEVIVCKYQFLWTNRDFCVASVWWWGIGAGRSGNTGCYWCNWWNTTVTVWVDSIISHWWCGGASWNWWTSWSWCAWWWTCCQGRGWGWWAWWAWCKASSAWVWWAWWCWVCWYWGWWWGWGRNTQRWWCGIDWWGNGNCTTGACVNWNNATKYWGWWWGWTGKCCWWSWCQWVVEFSYAINWDCWIRCATWWNCCYESWWYRYHRFTSSWTFTVVS